MTYELDAVLARLQNLPIIDLSYIDEQGQVQFWYSLSAKDLLADLVVNEQSLVQQVQIISAQIFHWVRMESLAKRVWDVRAREYRIWRDSLHLALIDPDANRGTGWKKPTQAAVDATIRSDPDYGVHYSRMEEAEETYSAIGAIVEGFRAKKVMLDHAIFKQHASSAPTMGVY